MSFHSAPLDMDSVSHPCSFYDMGGVNLQLQYSYYPQQYSHVNSSAYPVAYQQHHHHEVPHYYDQYQQPSQSYVAQSLPSVAHVLGHPQNYSPTYVPTDIPSPDSPHDQGSPTSKGSYSRTGSIVPPLEKTFVCPICSTAFARNHDLTRHQKGHDATKAYKCAGCSKSFTRKDALKRHATQKSCGGEYNAKTVQVVTIDPSASMSSSPPASCSPNSASFSMTMPSPAHRGATGSDSDSGSPYHPSAYYHAQNAHLHHHSHQQRY